MSSPDSRLEAGIFQQLFDASPDPAWIIEGNRRIACNDAAVTAFGHASREEFLGARFEQLSPPLQADGEASRDKAARVMALVRQNGVLRFDWLHARADGSHFETEVTLRAFEAGGRSFVSCVSHDITERRKAERLLRLREQEFLALSTMSSDWFWLQDENYRFIDFSGAFAVDFTPPADSVGKTRWELNVQLTPEQWAAHRADLDARRSFRNFEYPITSPSGELRWYSINGDPRFDDTGRFIGYHGTGRNITALKEAEERIKELAFYDQLTGLPNRTLLLDRLRQAMAAGERSEHFGALLFIDLDYFKTINDTRGHDVGDQLLTQAARRLRACVRQGDTVSRLGGDEFIVMLPGLSANDRTAAASAETVSEKILERLNENYRLGELDFHCTASIGVTLFRGQQVTVEELMKQADLAMYKSKAAGRNTMRFFDPAMEASALQRAALEDDLRHAIQAGQLELHYQPQVGADGRAAGAEALLRYRHPVRGLVSPAEFIPLAEETGLIVPMGRWVLQTACAQLAAWAAVPGLRHLTVAVNVSAHQIRQVDFVDDVLDILAHTGANPQRLKLELTESVLVSNVEDTIAKMAALKAAGVGFSLDDFGTGYSSLSYLKRMPLDQLKIDRSFVRDVLTDPNDAVIARTIIALAHSLSIDVIAEGVETEAERDFLAEAGCPAYQGFLFSRPLPLKDFEALLALPAVAGAPLTVS